MALRYLTLAASASIAAAAAAAAGTSGTAEDNGRIVVFGDDLGDTGNLQQATNNSNIGYSGGRLTNGPTFAEYMATALGLKHRSYSFAHATVDDNWGNTAVDKFEIPSLDNQVANFTKNERDWVRHRSGIRNSVAVVSAGASDVIQQSERLLAHPSDGQQFARQLVDSVFEQVETLGKLEFRGIMVVNLPALYIMPRWRMLASVDRLHSLITKSNTMFRESFVEHDKTMPKTRLWMLDVESFMLVTANHTFSKAIGARNTTSPCVTSTGSCDDPANYVFYDDSHMDVRLNHLLGLAAANMASGGEVQYNASYFGQLAREYDIGVLHHTTATMMPVTESKCADSAQPGTATAGDPLLTSPQSPAPSCSLTAMCTAGSASTAAAGGGHVGSPRRSSGSSPAAQTANVASAFTWACIAGLGAVLVAASA